MNWFFGPQCRAILTWALYGSVVGSVLGFLAVFVFVMQPLGLTGAREKEGMERGELASEKAHILSATSGDTRRSFSGDINREGVFLTIARIKVSNEDARGALEAINSIRDQKARDAALYSIVEDLVQSYPSDVPHEGSPRHPTPAKGEPAIKRELIPIYLELARAIRDEAIKAKALTAVAKVLATNLNDFKGADPVFQEAIAAAKAADATIPLAVPPLLNPSSSRLGTGRQMSPAAQPEVASVTGPPEPHPVNAGGWWPVYWPVGLAVFGFVFGGLFKPTVDAIGQTLGKKVAASLEATIQAHAAAKPATPPITTGVPMPSPSAITTT
jgi:hypothetical protein